MPVFKRYTRYSPVLAENLMSRPPITASEDASIDDVARIMWENKVGCVLVVDRENRLVGVLTERDMLYASAHLLFGRDVRAKSIMSKNLVTSSPQDDVLSVVEKMRDFNIRHIPVIDRDGVPLGVISTRDILDFGMRMLSLFIRPD